MQLPRGKTIKEANRLMSWLSQLQRTGFTFEEKTDIHGKAKIVVTSPLHNWKGKRKEHFGVYQHSSTAVKKAKAFMQDLDSRYDNLSDEGKAVVDRYREAYRPTPGRVRLR